MGGSILKVSPILFSIKSYQWVKRIIREGGEKTDINTDDGDFPFVLNWLLSLCRKRLLVEVIRLKRQECWNIDLEDEWLVNSVSKGKDA